MLSRLNRLIETVDNGIEDFQFSEAAMALYHFVWREFCDWYIEFSKSTLNGDDEAAKCTTYACLAWGLDVILRLLHPFMPFITEEIWQMLPMPREELSICVAPFPKPDSRYLDEASELEMGIVMAFVEAVRSIRGENNIPPSTKVRAIAQTDDIEKRALLEKQSSMVALLAGLSELDIQPLGEKPKCAGVDFCMGMEVFIPLEGVVDLEEERLRVQREISKTEKDLSGLLKKLENPNFVARAPKEVIEKDKARIEELQAKLQKMSEHLQRISLDEEDTTPKTLPQETLPQETPPRKTMPRKTRRQKPLPQKAKAVSPKTKTMPSKKKAKPKKALPEKTKMEQPKQSASKSHKKPVRK
jgi:valyl-tRNA synthetase